MTPYFFGFGSLVNTATHVYGNTRPARLQGWRRAWVHTPALRLAFLSATPADGHAIDGLLAAVPGGDWAALDEREFAYVRVDVTAQVGHDMTPPPQISLYQVPQADQAAGSVAHPILLSYLDVVLRGYTQVFGAAGAEAFMTSTDGWDTPILDDRAAPQYPRHQEITPSERDFHDRLIADVGASVLAADT
ncbi:gamma-glutamylcyclotransferase family protein [Phaeobacter sp. B1627]|uniref:gamma-glutamylcyclotransferase family protein n=1 Tax=Phaeobacter sp. B1627 TaxID=2583809 RepID=UPI00111A6618|nr:gamma-glutamylcyclotransferase family protein [Phaeobacter sp. B1627]TNJ44796.1 gamma-glutamylcyclotransferase [Phaeobacter sp. B1627]